MIGYFNNKKMYYQDRLGKTIIEATEKDGVYVLDKITATYSDAGELEEIGTGHALSNQVIEEEQEGAGDSEPEVQDKNVVETYQLYHRRFAHLGSAKIGAIHKMTTHAKPVKVAKCECEVCQETKIVKRKGKVAD